MKFRKLAAAALALSLWGRGWTFAGINLVLGCFNLLPVSVMDGGRALACTLALLAGPETAGRVGETLDRAFTAAMLACGLLLAGAWGNITMLLAALWLLAGMLQRRFPKRKGQKSGRKRDFL